MTIKIEPTPVASKKSSLIAEVYGRAGTGKTAFAATFPKPLLLIDVDEGGTDTIAKIPDIDVVEVLDWETFLAVYWYAQNHSDEYATIVIDQSSKLQDLVIKYLVPNSDSSKPLTRQIWGQASGLLKEWLFAFRELCKTHQKHLIYLAHQRTNTVEDIEDQIDPSIGPNLMPSISSALNGAVDFIGNTFIREDYLGKEKKRIVEYCMRVGPHAYYTTKIRRPVDARPLPEYLVNPTYHAVMSLIHGPTSKRKRTQ